jgi:multidrug efflux pump subunit AcrA (membrane-fusion protein)
MSAAVAFDTLKFVEKLEAAGVPHAQAKATAEAFAEATSQELATKADLERVRADLGLAKAELETKIEATKAEIIKWLFGTIGFQTLVFLGAVLALARLSHP